MSTELRQRMIYLAASQGCRIRGALGAPLPGNFSKKMTLPGNLIAKTDLSGNLKRIQEIENHIQ